VNCERGAEPERSWADDSAPYFPLGYAVEWRVLVQLVL
jgi:hypothetical protein